MGERSHSIAVALPRETSRTALARSQPFTSNTASRTAVDARMNLVLRMRNAKVTDAKRRRATSDP